MLYCGLVELIEAGNRRAGMAAAFGVQLGHHEEPQVSSHLLASVPEHTFVECFDEERDPFFWNLTDMSTRIRDGRYHLPERPGFGIEFDLRLRRGAHHRPAGHHALTAR